MAYDCIVPFRALGKVWDEERRARQRACIELACGIVLRRRHLLKAAPMAAVAAERAALLVDLFDKLVQQCTCR